MTCGGHVTSLRYLLICLSFGYANSFVGLFYHGLIRVASGCLS